jgi:hypothetical protein
MGAGMGGGMGAGMGGGMGGMMGRGGAGMNMPGMMGSRGMMGHSGNPAAGAPPEYAHLSAAEMSADPFAPGADARMLRAVGNPGADSANPMDAGSLMPNGSHMMFENQNSGKLLKIQANGDVDFTGVLMDHRVTMVRVLRAPDGIHYRIGSVNFPERWLQILPDGSVNGLGTVDSPYGEFELCTPKPFHFTFVGCATHFSLAAHADGRAAGGVEGMPLSAVFKFGAPPTAGKKPYPEYLVADRSLYIAMAGAAAMDVAIKGPEFDITGPEVEFDEQGRIKSVKGGSVSVKSMGSASASAEMSVAAVAMTAEEIKKHHGVHCAGFMPPAGDGKVPEAVAASK